MPARLVCSQCGAVLAESTRSIDDLYWERNKVKQCPKCKRKIPAERDGDKLFVENKEIGVLLE